jgi:RelA/SpoT family (p)ppGpp synthetase
MDGSPAKPTAITSSAPPETKTSAGEKKLPAATKASSGSQKEGFAPAGGAEAAAGSPARGRRRRLMRQYELVERVLSYDPDADEELLNRAYVYAMKAHGDQKRASGDPYFSHPLEVAAILTELKLDDATIATALLHDVVEDTDTTLEEIRRLFGEEIAGLVEGLTKIRRLDLISREAAQAENLRRFLIAVSRDVRVLLVKLADRLHNMRTLEHMPPHKQRRIAEETMDIYAPLAGRMGLQNIREELEDLAFRVLKPDAYARIRERLRELEAESHDTLEEIRAEIEKVLAEKNLTASVTGRRKRPYSIWRKMQMKRLSLSQVTDIFGFRIIVDEVDDCYRALGAVHQAWKVVPGRFKDYISMPKMNGYRSIHTTVRGPGGRPVELQIRTWHMHELAERGVAAHGLYKDARSQKESEEGVTVPVEVANAYRWLRELVERLEDGRTPQDFLEHTRLELFTDQVFCFTPKGDLIVLPRGATAIDFAYAVHTDIGNAAVGCRINGHHAPLITQLNNGDEVEIITSPTREVPPAAWEKVVVTGKARAAIRRANRLATRAEYIGLGEEILERWLERFGRRFDRAALAKAFPRLGILDVDDGLEALGRGELRIGELLDALGVERQGEEEHPVPGRRGTDSEGRLLMRSAVIARGVDRPLPIRISPLTGAVPGERIVGIPEDDGITIHPIFSRALEKYEDRAEEWVDMRWNEPELDGALFPARIRVTVHNEVGALAEVAGIISRAGANIENLVMTHRASDFYDFDIMVEVRNAGHLNDILLGLRQSGMVAVAERFSG